MKKKNLVLTFIIAIAIMGTLSINITLLKNDLQYSLALENIEALARGEGDIVMGEECVIEGYEDINRGSIKPKCIDNCNSRGFYTRVSKKGNCWH